MKEITIINQTVAPASIIQVAIDFEQLFNLVQQLSNQQQVAFLDKLQAKLEAEKLIKPRTDEDQRRDYVPAPKPHRPGYKKPLVTQELIEKWEAEEEEEEELDANLTERELVEMLKEFS